MFAIGPPDAEILVVIVLPRFLKNKTVLVTKTDTYYPFHTDLITTYSLST